MTDLFRNPLFNAALVAFVSLAALNYGTVELLDTNLLTDVLALSTEIEEVANVAFGASGLLGLYAVAAEMI